eukprot:5427904-Pyramimonas_sp.AAC.1
MLAGRRDSVIKSLWSDPHPKCCVRESLGEGDDRNIVAKQTEACDEPRDDSVLVAKRGVTDARPQGPHCTHFKALASKYKLCHLEVAG